MFTKEEFKMDCDQCGHTKEDHDPDMKNFEDITPEDFPALKLIKEFFAAGGNQVFLARDTCRGIVEEFKMDNGMEPNLSLGDIMKLKALMDSLSPTMVSSLTALVANLKLISQTPEGKAAIVNLKSICGEVAKMS